LRSGDENGDLKMWVGATDIKGNQKKTKEKWKSSNIKKKNHKQLSSLQQRRTKSNKNCLTPRKNYAE
jgi:hypothetical protein